MVRNMVREFAQDVIEPFEIYPGDGFLAADEASLPENLRVTHKSLFVGSLQGIHRTDKPSFSFQGHPEASPGPHDAAPLFDHFIELIKEYKKA